MLLNKETKECLIVDIPVPGDTRVKINEDESQKSLGTCVESWEGWEKFDVEYYILLSKQLIPWLPGCLHTSRRFA